MKELRCPPKQEELKYPVKEFSKTFSAEKVIIEKFFKEKNQE